MRVLVTGATGFVGLNLLAAMGEDHEPVALVRPGSTTARLPDGVETVEGDLDSLGGALDGVDAVVHLAAAVYAESAMAATNVAGTERLLDAAAEAGIDHFVFLSTIGAHPHVESDPDSAYQRSKVAAEELLFEADHPFDVAAVYPTYILGPRDYRLTRYEHVRPVAANRLLVPPLYTYDEYNVVHVEDVVGTVRHCLDGNPGRHLVTGPNLTTRQVLGTIADATDGQCHILPVPYSVMRWGIKPAIDLLAKVGVSPVGGAAFTERGDYGTVPPALTERAPVAQRSWQSALTDTVAWYREVGIL
ncbi:NAD-dependent epimerase/dehydratase family protein [Halapricum sp. CBA1109]|uniref:NAD-dependent epimerase/dehydratase family protein n=1 Tax=Halapricum sp. CBA1109 TaxID=2668068 RepID=UPI0012F8F888|nr:NAD-dependent epimerase/dehydratase family protein [Halapricum sp. CBA1109]MUV89286.1 NAD-dependent epimerase/dehydratase family protein [Halapricum sp. CBA1109]